METGQQLKMLEGNSPIAFSPDGKTLVSVYLFDIQLWDVKTGEITKTLEGHTVKINSIAFSPDGKTLASGSCQEKNEDYDCVKGDIKLWNLETEEEISSLEGHSNEVNSVAFSPDGKILASGSCEEEKDYSCIKGDLKLWNIETKQIIKSFIGLTNSVNLIVFSPDSKTIASLGEYEDTIKLWDTQTGNQLKTLKGHVGSVNSIAFSKDGKILASGSSDNSIKLWNTATGSQIKSRKVLLNQPGHWHFRLMGKLLLY